MRALGPLAVALLLAAPGCLGIFGVPDYHASVTPLQQGPGAWNRDGGFQVQVLEPGIAVHIEAKELSGRIVQAAGTSRAQLDLPDGTWSIDYSLNGHDWGSYTFVQVDATPPEIRDLPLVVLAPTGAATLGQGASIVGASATTISDLDTEAVLGSTLPLPLSGLAAGLHLYRIAAHDEAYNWANATVQVRVGSTADLPAGQYDFGVVARYNDAVRIWDIRHLENFDGIAAAQQKVQGSTGASYLGSGFGVTPSDPDVQAIVAAQVPSGATTGQAALALYRWMAANLQYDNNRLTTTSLQTPAETMLDTEDKGGADLDHDGLVDAGSGNGVKGGVCRDLAGLYVSLLRAAGVPARLVTGYVAGEVKDFHAWVEFYGAPSTAPSPWVPVDVSAVGQSNPDQVLLFTFGIQLPEYLMLRQLPPTAEVRGWEAAGELTYSYPADATPPKVRFTELVTPSRTQVGVLCVNLATKARSTADPGPPTQREKNCSAGSSAYLYPFTVATERTIDYGITIDSAPRGTVVTAKVAYPFDDPEGQDFVTYQFYGPSFTRDELTGKATGTIRR